MLRSMGSQRVRHDGAAEQQQSSIQAGLSSALAPVLLEYLPTGEASPASAGETHQGGV